MSHSQIINPCFYLLSNYESADTGSEGQYDASMRLYFPDLDFGIPDYNKVLEKVEVFYLSLREVPVTVQAFRRYPLTDAGSAAESTTAQTYAAQAEEPGVFFNTTLPTWGTAVYATMRLFSAVARFTVIQGKSIGIGVKANADLTPFKIIKILVRYNIEDPNWKGAGVIS